MKMNNFVKKATALLVIMPEKVSETPEGDPNFASNGHTASKESLLAASNGSALSEQQTIRSASLIESEQSVSGQSASERKGEAMGVVGASAESADLNISGGLLNGDTVDFAAIYRSARLAEDTFGAEQIGETLRSLPQGLPLETRRDAVGALISALGKETGATLESVVADASRKKAALESFSSFIAEKTTELISQSEQEIDELEQQLRLKRQVIARANHGLLKISGSCQAESDRLDDIVRFFNLDAHLSKIAAESVPEEIVAPLVEVPKLQEALMPALAPEVEQPPVTGAPTAKLEAPGSAPHNSESHHLSKPILMTSRLVQIST